MGFSQAPGLPYNKLGIPEDGDTASRAISKGKYVIWKGKNYFAKTDILQGETFVEDTNLTEIPDGALNGIADALNASFPRFIGPIIDEVPQVSGQAYTVQQDCWLYVRTAGVTGQGLTIKNEYEEQIYSYWENGNGTSTSSCSNIIPLKKGQTIKVYPDSSWPRYTNLAIHAMI